MWLGRTLLAQAVEQEARLAVQGTAFHGMHEGADRPAASGASNSTGTSQVGIWRAPRAGQGAAGGEVPVVDAAESAGSRLVVLQSSLHVVAFGDHRARQEVARASMAQTRLVGPPGIISS